jgi:hypothetical protein
VNVGFFIAIIAKLPSFLTLRGVHMRVRVLKKFRVVDDVQRDALASCLHCPFFTVNLACYRLAKYLRPSVNKKVGFDRDVDGNDDGKSRSERGKKERNSVLRDDRKRRRGGLLTMLVDW